jgi:hypothetical protein
MAPITNIQKVVLGNIACTIYLLACLEFNLGLIEWLFVPTIPIWFITLLICIAEGSHNMDRQLTNWVRK